MNTVLPIILGIAAGARRIGVAVFHGTDLIFYGVKTIRDKNDDLTLARTLRILKESLHNFDVTHIALAKIVFVQQHRSFVKIVFDEVRNFLKKEQIPSTEYNPRVVRKAICKIEKPTKANTARIIAERYPELRRFFNVPKIWQKRYYDLLLDAVAVGLVCARDHLSDDDP